MHTQNKKAEQRKMEVLMIHENNIAKGKNNVSRRQTSDIKS